MTICLNGSPCNRDSILYYVAVGAALMATLIIWSQAKGVDVRVPVKI